VAQKLSMTPGGLLPILSRALLQPLNQFPKSALVILGMFHLLFPLFFYRLKNADYYKEGVVVLNHIFEEQDLKAKRTPLARDRD
jgi:hypothetical protein